MINIVSEYHQLHACDVVPEWYIDLSQNVNRSQGVGTASIHTLTTTSRPFSFRRNRLLTCQELYKVQGYGNGDVNFDLIPESRCRQRLGETMHATSVATVLQAFYLNPLAPWWH